MIDTMLKPSQLKSKYLKSQLMHWLFWRLHNIIIIDEFDFADIFSIQANGYTKEYEIKVSKSDFDREIRIIRMTCEQVTKWGKDFAKWRKHQTYLNKPVGINMYNGFERAIRADEYSSWTPNEFWFYVPDFLAQHAISQCSDLPYGVAVIGKSTKYAGHGRYFREYEVVKKATKLHTQKAGDALYRQAAHALTVRNRLFNQYSREPVE